MNQLSDYVCAPTTMVTYIERVETTHYWHVYHVYSRVYAAFFLSDHLHAAHHRAALQYVYPVDMYHSRDNYRHNIVHLLQLHRNIYSHNEYVCA
jgi:hypothetical protein